MKVLVLSDLWPPFPGGAERLMFNLARDLHRRGVDVGVVTGYEHAERFDGPPVHVIDVLPEVALLVAAMNPGAIVTHHVWAYSHQAELARCGVPVVQVVLNGRRLPFAAAAVYISEWVRTQAGGGEPGDLVITPPVFDDVVADAHEHAIGFVKPLPHKGVDLFWRIAAAMPDRRFVVLRGEWQTLEDVTPAEALPNVELLDPVADMRDFWRRVDLVLVPSLSEDAGTVAQEATANGVPCISSDVQGLRETNAGGMRLPTNSAMRWTRAIRSLDQPTARARLVERQRRHLDATDQDGRLAALHEIVAMLAR